jgi:hypothetical protein
MAAQLPRHYLLLQILVSASVIGFTLFIIRLALFWTGVLPTFGKVITTQIVLEWLMTFLFNSFALFIGRYLQGRARSGEEIPPMVKGVVLVMVFILLFQIYSIVFRSWAGLTYNQAVQERQSRSSGPFQPF